MAWYWNLVPSTTLVASRSPFSSPCCLSTHTFFSSFVIYIIYILTTLPLVYLDPLCVYRTKKISTEPGDVCLVSLCVPVYFVCYRKHYLIWKTTYTLGAQRLIDLLDVAMTRGDVAPNISLALVRNRHRPDLRWGLQTELHTPYLMRTALKDFAGPRWATSALC